MRRSIRAAVLALVLSHAAPVLAQALATDPVAAIDAALADLPVPSLSAP